MVFDPFDWCARYIPEGSLHRLIRLTMALVFAFFLYQRLSHYGDYVVKALWLAETLIFAILTAAFLLRTTPRIRSRGVRDIVMPLIGSALPFALLSSPPAAAVIGNRALLYGILWEMTVATLLTVAGMWCLRRSFSITVEARSLVTWGPYRLVRHPIYLGEILATAGVAFVRLSAANLLLFALFVTIQLCRTRWEEEKLNEAFPEYRKFASRSRWFW